MSLRFDNSGDVFNWFNTFVNLGSGQSRRSFRLDRMKALAAMAGNPERRAPAIHVAGSKGKGSVTAMAASILDAAGYKTARYCSPFVSDSRERVTLANRFFDEETYTACADELAALLEKMPALPQVYALFDPANAAEGGEAPAFFELMTLYFFMIARRENCGAMVVETGMGGRLDATNIIEPEVSVITLIEKEHTEYLGASVAEIAAEKAGIIKPGRPVLLAEEEREAFDVFARAAAELRAPLRRFRDEINIGSFSMDKTGSRFALEFADKSIFPDAIGIALPVPGMVQAENAGLAALAAKLAFPAVTAEAVRRGLAAFFLPGRFEHIGENPDLVIDGAHTPHSVAYCADTFTRLYGSGGVLIFGCAAGKDARAMAEILCPRFSRIIITTPGTFKKSRPAEVFEIFAQAAGGGAAKVTLIENTEAAIREALRIAAETGKPILGTGSFYLAGEIRKACMPTQRP